MSDGSTLASNTDRERVVARLAEAHVDGRLTVEELDRLTGEAHAARTLGDLDLVCANLPGAAVARPARAEIEAREPYSAGQIAGMTALTIILPLGRLIGLVTALSLLRGESHPQRRRMLLTWAYVCAALLAVEIAALLILVVF
jgi:Domain of unknown function (DUF1707)